MDKKQVAVMLGMIREVYGQYSESPNPEMLITLWHRYLCDEPADLVQQAVDKYIANNKYAPKPAEILDLIEEEKCRIWNDYAGAESLYRMSKQYDVKTDIEEPKPIPSAYLPQWISRKPKQYEIANQEKILKSIEGFDKIGALPEGKETKGEINNGI